MASRAIRAAAHVEGVRMTAQQVADLMLSADQERRRTGDPNGEHASELDRLAKLLPPV